MYSYKMGNCVDEINKKMNENLENMINVFELFYKFGVENLEVSGHKLN